MDELTKTEQKWRQAEAMKKRQRATENGIATGEDSGGAKQTYRLRRRGLTGGERTRGSELVVVGDV